MNNIEGLEYKNEFNLKWLNCAENTSGEKIKKKISIKEFKSISIYNSYPDLKRRIKDTDSKEIVIHKTSFKPI